MLDRGDSKGSAADEFWDASLLEGKVLPWATLSGGWKVPAPHIGTGAFIRHHTALGRPVAPLRAGQGGVWTGCPSLLAGQSLGTAEKVALQTSGQGGGALRPPTLPASFFPGPSSLALCSGSAPTFSRPPHCGGRDSPYPLFPFQVLSRKLCLLPTSLSGFNSLVRKTGNRSKHFLCIPATLIHSHLRTKWQENVGVGECQGQHVSISLGSRSSGTLEEWPPGSTPAPAAPRAALGWGWGFLWPLSRPLPSPS